MAVLQKNKNKVTLDEILGQFNIFGRYHFSLIIYIFVLNVADIVFGSSFVFIAQSDGYRCRDSSFGNNTCIGANNSDEVCSKYIYNNPDSFLAEFQLACQEWKRTLVGTTHMFGHMIGLPIVGCFSDRVGRKSAMIVTTTLAALFGVAKSFTTVYWGFIALEFLEAASGNSFSPGFVMTMEMVMHEKRVLCKMLYSFGSSFGYVVLALIAWCFPYWRTMLLVAYTPAFLFLSYTFLLDESPRWLLSKGRKDKAIKIIEKAAKKNSIQLDKSDLNNLTYEDEKTMKFLELLKETFKSRKLLIRFFICLVWWTTSSFVCYGLRVNILSLPGDKYINFGLLMIVDVIAKATITYFISTFGRKMPLLYYFMLAGVFCVLQPFMPKNLSWLSIVLYMAGSVMMKGFLTITFIYTSELFPTYTRNSMISLCSSIGSIGSVIATQTPLLMAYWHGLPFFLFGCASLLAGIVTLFAPDIRNSDVMPDTVHQAETQGKPTLPE